MTRRTLWIILAVVAVVALAVGAQTPDAQTPDQRLRALGSEIRCPTCAGQAVATSDAPAARAIRSQILSDIEAGRDDDTIRARLVASYGEDILLTPPRSGFAGLVWIVPVAAVIAAFGALALVFRRWGREERSGPSRSDRALVAAALAEADDDPHGEGVGR